MSSPTRRIARIAWVAAPLAVLAGLGARVAGQTPDASRLTLDAISTQAAATAVQLRALIPATSDQSALAALEDDVLHYRQRVSDRWAETVQLFAGTPGRVPLEALASSWRSLHIEIASLQAVVDEHTHRRDNDLQALDRLRQSWAWNLDHAHRTGAPESVIAQIEATLASIGAARDGVQQRSARLLVLQDALAQSIGACDEAAARIEEARRQAVARVFVQRDPPIWRIGTRTGHDLGRDSLAPLSRELALRLESLRIYLRAYWRGMVVALLLFLALSVLLYRLRAQAARDPASRAALPASVADVFRAPISTALLLAFFLSRPLRPLPPLTLGEILLLITYPTALILLRPLMERRLMAPLYALGALLVIEIGRRFLSVMPSLNQVILILQMSAAAWVLMATAARLSASADALTRRSPALRTAGRRLCRAAAGAAATAAIAAALGNVELADLVGGGALALVFIAIGLLGIRIAGAGVLVLALAHTRLVRLRTVQAHGAGIERAIGRALDLTVLGFWLLTALGLFELEAPLRTALATVLDARLQVGELDLAVRQVLGFAAVVVIAWLTARAVVFLLEEDVYPRLTLPRGVPYALSMLTRYGLLLGGFFLALGTLGLDLTRLTVLVSAFGLGVGFGMQQIINNFVSGLILLFERPVQVGDAVQVDDLSGQMLRIGIRSSTIRTGEGAEVIVPNSKLIEERVTNWTLSDRKRRVDLALRVPYGTDAARVLALLVEVAQRDARVMRVPEPESLFTGFGDRTLDFELRVWTEEARWMRLRSDLGVAIQDALRAAGIDDRAVADARGSTSR